MWFLLRKREKGCRWYKLKKNKLCNVKIGVEKREEKKENIPSKKKEKHQKWLIIKRPRNDLGRKAVNKNKEEKYL